MIRVRGRARGRARGRVRVRVRARVGSARRRTSGSFAGCAPRRAQKESVKPVLAAGKCASGGRGSTPLPSKEKKAGGAARSAMT